MKRFSASSWCLFTNFNKNFLVQRQIEKSENSIISNYLTSFAADKDFKLFFFPRDTICDPCSVKNFSSSLPKWSTLESTQKIAIKVISQKLTADRRQQVIWVFAFALNHSSYTHSLIAMISKALRFYCLREWLLHKWWRIGGKKKIRKVKEKFLYSRRHRKFFLFSYNREEFSRNHQHRSGVEQGSFKARK